MAIVEGIITLKKKPLERVVWGRAMKLDTIVWRLQ